MLATIVDADSRARAAKSDPDAPAPPRGPESEAADRAIVLAKEGKVDEAIAAAMKIQWLDTKVRALAGIAASAPASADQVYRLMVGLAAKFDARSSGRPSIAAALADAGRPGLALEVMDPVREIPVGEWALIHVGKAQARTGDFAGARATIDGRLKTRAGRVPALCAVARALNDAGRRDEAVAAVREAEATAGGIEPDFAAVGTLATALHKAGRRDEARRWADRASNAVDSTVYAYVSGSDLGTVMYGREPTARGGRDDLRRPRPPREDLAARNPLRPERRWHRGLFSPGRPHRGRVRSRVGRRAAERPSDLGDGPRGDPARVRRGPDRQRPRELRNDLKTGGRTRTSITTLRSPPWEKRSPHRPSPHDG